MRLLKLSLFFVLLCSSLSKAQTMSQAGSGVQAYFGSQSGGYTQADPAGPAPIAGAPGVGGWTPLYTPLPGLPTPPTPTVFPGPYPGTASSNFQVAGGYTSFFTDSLPWPTGTKALSNIADVFNPTPSNSFDARIDIPIWRFFQEPSAIGYAWEQLNFAADYLVTTTGALPGGSPVFPLFVAGNVSGAGNFVQLDGRVEYTWIGVNTTGTLGSPISLGTLDYTFTAGTGPFMTTVLNTGTIGLIPASSTGYLELTGHFYVGGDPFDIVIGSDVSVLPEPTTLSLLSAGSLALLARRKKA